MSVPSNRDFLLSLLAVFAAKSGVQFIEEIQGTVPDIAPDIQGEDEVIDLVDIPCSIFIHGARIAVTGGARECRLEELEFFRRDESVLLIRRQEQDAGDALNNEDRETT